MVLRILTWNIRGATHVSKKNFLKTLYQRHKLAVLCLLKPMMKLFRILKVHSIYMNSSNKIWVLFTHRINMDVIRNVDQILDCTLEHPGLGFNPQVNFLYAKNSYVERRSLREQIREHYTNQTKGVVLWDFNRILENEERTGSFRDGFGPCPKFRNSMQDAYLEDTWYIGTRFIWTNGHIW